MKKLLTFLTLLTLFFGVGWAETKTATFDFTTSQTSPVTVNGVTFSWTSSNIVTGGGNSSGFKAHSSMTVTLPDGATLTNISKTNGNNWGSGAIINVYPDVSNTTIASIVSGTNSYSVTSSNTGGVFIFENGTTKNAWIKTLSIIYDLSAPVQTYVVTCNSAANGSISVGSTTSYARGTTVTVSATPADGYKLSTVTVTPATSGITAPAATITGNTATFEMPASDVTVDATFEPITYVQYKLVDNENDLTSGSDYLIVGNPASKPYSAILGPISGNIGTTIKDGYIYDANNKTISIDENSSATVITIEKSSSYWTLYNGSGYLALTSSANNLNIVTSATSTNAQWTIDTNELPSSNVLIKNNSYTNRYLEYNSSNDRFACYQTSSNQLPIALFKKIEVGAHSITIDNAIENGTVASNKASANSGDQVTLTVTPEAGYELTALSYNGTAITPLTGGSDQSTYTFTMPDDDVTITATFSPRRYKVDYTQTTGGKDNGEHGVLLISGTTYNGQLGYSTAEYNSEVVFKVCPEYGYQINTVTVSTAGGSTVTATPGETNSSHDYYGTYYTIAHMPADAITIAVTFKQGDIYIIGTANDNAWDGNTGVLMTYNATPNTYTARVYFKGDSEASGEVLGYGRFSFAEHLSGENGSWSNMGARYGANNKNEDPTSGTHNWTRNDSDPNAFMVQAGIYDITVNWGTGQVTATKVEPEVTLNKPSGALETGTTVTVTSNLTQLLSAIKSGVSATLAYSTDDGTSYTDGSSFPVNQAMTAKGKAYYGKIEAESDSYAYTVVTHYAVNCSVNPENCGTVTATPASAIVGENVALTINPNTGYEIGSVTVNGDEITPVDGAYSFTMPAAVANVVVNFNIIGYNITTVTTNCTIDVAPSANYNQKVTFSVTPRSDKYEVSSVTVTYGDGRTKPVTDNGDGTYSFYMPDDNVTLTVICTRKSTGGNQFTLVKSQTDIVAGGEYVILNAATTQAMTKTSSNNYDAYSTQYNLDGEIVTLTEGSDVSILKFIDGSTTGTFKIQDGNLYLTAASKKLNATANGSDWTVTLGSDNNVTIQSGNWVIKNNANYFRCYDSSTGTLVKLYKRLPAGVSVEIDPTTGNVIGSQVVNVGSDTDGALVQYKVEKQNGSNWDVVTDWTEWTTYTEANGPVEFTITGNVGDVYQVTARAKEADQVVDPDEEEDFDEQTVQYTFVAPNAPTITPASCSVVDVKQNVTITSEYTNGVIEYSTDGGDTWNTYDGAFDVILSELGTSATVTARVTVNGVQSETVSAIYTRNVQPVVFSPISGTYYYGEQSVEMFSISQGARIYYSMTDDGSEPADPLMNDGGTLYTGPIEGLEAGNTYKFKAYAYIGTIKSEISTATYTITNHSDSYWQNIAAMNTDNNNVTKYFENPVQIVYMSTYQNNGTKPEFAYVRDNSGYGLVYFGNKDVTKYNNYTKFQMGDWLAGKSVQGTTTVWYDGFHNELGNSSGSVSKWPESAEGNTAIIPKTVTNAQIKAGWDGDESFSGTSVADYQSMVNNNNMWGHYIHLRNNTVSGLEKVSGKYKGVMQDQNEDKLTYYDAFYKFSGFGSNAKTYDQSFYTTRQNKGATFDFYGIVAFYGPDARNAEYANQPFQIIPIDILWVYKPAISGVNSTDVYTTSKTVTLALDPVQGDDESNSVIWYKTSEMEDFAIYTGSFEVSTSTTIETYTTKMTSYNDRMESVHETMDVHFTVINPPVIAPESQVKAVGSESINSTITRDDNDGLSNVTIFFTIDGSDPSDPSSERYVYNVQNQAAMLSDIRTTTTVRAVAAVGNDQDGYAYSAEAESRTYTFVKSNGIVYDLVNNINQLNSNGVYVIVSRKYSEALSNVQNTSNRGAAGVLFVDDTQAQVYGNDDVAVFTLTPLTDATDTGNEKHFLFHTNNGKTNAATGYLHVGANDDNTLLTEAEEDAMGNDVAVITIDADGRAHIHFNYSGQDNRYLQYWNRDRLFNTYKSEYDDRAVYIYYKNATPLATIEKEGVTTDGMNQYTIADQLQVVYMQEDMLWCKDQGNVSIAKTENPDPENIIDYMTQYGGFKGDWDQSNWVALKFTGASSAQLEELNGYVGKYIAPASVTGHYINDVNYTIEVPISSGQENILQTTEGEEYSENLYCTANFLRANHNGNATGHTPATEDKHYFFMNPKIQEICEVTFAMWNGEYFVVPEANGVQNDSRIYGAFQVDWKYNNNGNVASTLNNMPNNVFKFLALVQRPETGNGTSSLKASNPNEPMQGVSVDNYYMVYPLNLNPADENQGNIVTAINTVQVGNGEIKSVKYVNVAGIVSDRPFQGVNIVVTEYTDGSRTTSKMLRK